MNRHYKMPGFLVSVTLHSGLLAALLWQQSFNMTETVSTTILPLNMEMFQMVQQVVAPQPAPEEVVEPVEETPVPEKKVEPVKPKKIVKKKAVVKKRKPREVAKLPEEVKPPAKTSPLKAQPSARPAVADAVISPASKTGEQDRIRERYIQELQKKIIAHKYYPKRAHRRHIEGRVEVGFVVLADGEINDIRLAVSSGEGVLDKAALEALRRAGRFAPLPKELGLRSWAFVVPIDYRIL
ncbi:MAG: TonB family protein [Gammaproteobacteria bacterium]|nr:TonB family protein [Gammaproteobacteria bacterium]